MFVQKSIGLLLALAVLLPGQAMAQIQPDTSDVVADTLERARQALTAVPPRQSCASSSDDEIVVCGRTDSSRYRVPQDSNNTDIGIPHFVVGAPSHMPGMVGGGVTIQGCFLQKCPKPQYYIDIAALPEAASGSDADKISKGEMAAH